jgi:LacI family transcriptional regulator
VLHEAGLERVGPVRFGNWTESWGRTAAQIVLDEGKDVDAILCGSDQIARGVLDTLRDRGVDVPGDMAVMGFDNWEAMVSGARPSLTTVDMQFETMGRRAAELLFASIGGHPWSGIEAIEPRIVVRDSTAVGR